MKQRQAWGTLSRTFNPEGLSASDIFASAIGCERVQAWLHESRINRETVRNAAMLSCETGRDVEELLAEYLEERAAKETILGWFDKGGA